MKALTLLAKLLGAAGVLFSWYLFLAPFPSSPPLFPYQDKVGHLLIYLGLTSWHLSLYPKRQKLLLWAFTAQGVVIEFLQPSFSRSFEYGDMLANAVGVTIAWSLDKMGFLHFLGGRHGTRQKI